MAEAFKLSPSIRSMVEILRKEDAQPPILPKAVQQAVRGWMTEIQAADELAAVGLAPRRTGMLSGPPGCGKTTLAHHLATRLGLPLVCVDMARLRSKWCGQTGENIANLFDAISEQADSCVLLLVEFDAVASKRSDDGQAATLEANAIVDALLMRVEGFTGTMIAATNRRDAIDPALWRRFGLQLEIPLPGDEERFAILTRYLAPFELPQDARDYLCDATSGAPPSLLRQLMEGVKRELVLAPRLGHSTKAPDVFARIMASVRPHSDYVTPPLWSEEPVRRRLEKMAWPPTRSDGESEEDAA